VFAPESLLTLPAIAGLTVVMGTDNILSIGVITAGLDPSMRPRARMYGLSLALVSRILVLCLLVWLMCGSQVSLVLLGHELALQHVLKLAGGCFLIGKSLQQIVQRGQQDGTSAGAAIALKWAVLQILFADQTQSLDSLVTVVGMAPNVVIMIAAIVIEWTVILFFATGVSRALARYPSLQTLAVCAMLLVGGTLVSEGIGMPISRTYTYSMMVFALFVELMDFWMGQRSRRLMRATRARAQRADEPGFNPEPCLPRRSLGEAGNPSLRLPRLVGTKRLLGQVVAELVEGPSPAAAADVLERTDAALAGQEAKIAQLPEDFAVPPDVAEVGLVDVAGGHRQISAGENLAFVRDEAHGCAGQAAPGDAVQGAFGSRAAMAGHRPVMLAGLLADDSVVMGGAGRLDLQAGGLLEGVDEMKSFLHLAGVQHLVIGDLLAAADGNQQEVVNRDRTGLLAQPQDGLDLVLVVPGDGAVNLGGHPETPEVPEGCQGAVECPPLHAKLVVGRGVRPVE
jgi:predicted tellurium resistance membrane protein TerC